MMSAIPKSAYYLCNIPLDIHLMVEKPEEKIGWFDFGEGDIVSGIAKAPHICKRHLRQFANAAADRLWLLTPPHRCACSIMCSAILTAL